MKGLLKPFLDIALTLYDDFEFKFMSLPRLVFFALSVAVIVSWIGIQFYGCKFEHFPVLVGADMTAGGWYVAKKFVEKGKAPNGQ